MAKLNDYHEYSWDAFLGNTCVYDGANGEEIMTGTHYLHTSGSHGGIYKLEYIMIFMQKIFLFINVKNGVATQTNEEPKIINYNIKYNTPVGENKIMWMSIFLVGELAILE